MFWYQDVLTDVWYKAGILDGRDGTKQDVLTDVRYKAGCTDGRDGTEQDVLTDACVRPGNLTDACVCPGDMQRRAYLRASRHRTVVPSETPNEKDLPLLGEYGTCKTVKAGFWPRLSGQSP